MDAILLYGATGYSGRLIAEQAQQRWSRRGSGLRLIVAGRTGAPLRDLARQLDVEYRTFALDDRRALAAGLQDVFAVINAAGPFALTAEALANAALRARCHYVDINGEVDVYKRLDDLGYTAVQRGVTMVCGAGHSAVASDLLLEKALRQLKANALSQGEPLELGAVRIALSQVEHPTRGSVQTVLRTVREQVVVVREAGPNARVPGELVLTYAPQGQIERAFDFGAGQHDDDASRADGRAARPSRRIATAVNLIDTLTARVTAARHDVPRLLRIESYLECSEALRAAHQWSSLVSPLWAIPPVRALAQRQIDLLPDGPTARERARERPVVVLEIDDIYGAPLIDWQLETPCAYDFTACSAVAVAERMPRPVGVRRDLAGWHTPAEFLLDDAGDVLDPCTDAPLVPTGMDAGRPDRSPGARTCQLVVR